MVATYLCNDTDVLTEAGWETLGGVLGVCEVLEAAGVKGQLEMLEVEGELED